MVKILSPYEGYSVTEGLSSHTYTPIQKIAIFNFVFCLESSIQEKKYIPAAQRNVVFFSFFLPPPTLTTLTTAYNASPLGRNISCWRVCLIAAILIVVLIYQARKLGYMRRRPREQARG